MPPSFLVLSRTNAAAYEPEGNELCISINDPDDPAVALSSKFKSVLRLIFSDIGEATRLHRPGDILFASEHAIRTIEFVSRWRDVDRIVVHCKAGMSRSPAVALGICEALGWPVTELQEKYPSSNKWVQKEFARAARERVSRTSKSSR